MGRRRRQAQETRRSAHQVGPVNIAGTSHKPLQATSPTSNTPRNSYIETTNNPQL
ncbi:hypothetical protein PABY_06640 [Pyrodictium abyssi]|uniref:Uncharacterized protein n=1 Tax=Pyrodictium abyssi TaxID=54256 RepID=A0ABM8IU63_9CREN|nr:hypothetical protein PABY_06640 [Pyrodictium abyssi]